MATVENENKPRRELSQSQVAFIAAIQKIGNELDRELADLPDLKGHLSDLFHERGLPYEEVVRKYFLESDVPLKQLVDGPFVKAFESTNLCTDSEIFLFERVRVSELMGFDTEEQNELSEEFGEWVEARSRLLASGLQRAVLDFNTLRRLTDEEIKQRSSETTKRWNEEHPGVRQEFLMLASKAALERREPYVFTPEVIGKIQEMFNAGNDYTAVVKLLAQAGISTTIGSLKSLVYRNDELIYTSGLDKIKNRREFERTILEVFEQTTKPGEAEEILVLRGYSRQEVRTTIKRLRLRKRLDWSETFVVDDQEFSLEQLLVTFPWDKSQNIRQNYKAFCTYLKQIGIDKVVNEPAYRMKLMDLAKRGNQKVYL